MSDRAVVPGPGHAPDVTVIVPVRNGAATITACVSSLLALRYARERFEIIVVDNDSTDATRSTLRAFGDHIRVLHEATPGVSAARNCGIRAARGRLIAFTDADCEVESGWLAALVAPLGEPRVGIVGGRVLSRVSGNRIERFGDVIHDHRQAILVEVPPYVTSVNWASRAEVLQEAGLFDETLLRGQDVDLSWRIHRLGYRLTYAPDAIMRHRNTRTIGGLMREGYIHGVAGVRLREKHAPLDARIRRRSRIGARMLGDLRQLARGSDLIDGVLMLLFNTGKSAGELVGLARGSRRHPVPAAAVRSGAAETKRG